MYATTRLAGGFTTTTSSSCSNFAWYHRAASKFIYDRRHSVKEYKQVPAKNCSWAIRPLYLTNVTNAFELPICCPRHATRRLDCATLAKTTADFDLDTYDWLDVSSSTRLGGFKCPSIGSHLSRIVPGSCPLLSADHTWSVVYGIHSISHWCLAVTFSLFPVTTHSKSYINFDNNTKNFLHTSSSTLWHGLQKKFSKR